MAGYKELVEDRELVKTAELITGTKAFYKFTGGSENEPAIGDSFSLAEASATIKTIKERPFFPDPADRSVWINKLMCSYSTKSGDETPREYDEDGRRFSIGAEIVSIDKPKNWTWDSDGEALKQPVFLSNIMGTFTRQLLLGSDSEKNSWIANRLLGYAGTINSVAWEGFTIGSVLWSGMSGGTQVDEDGERSWLFDCEFTYRVIRDEAAAITQDDWLYIWRKDFVSAGKPKWDKPKDINGNYLYAKKDLEQIFNGVSPE